MKTPEQLTIDFINKINEAMDIVLYEEDTDAISFEFIVYDKAENNRKLDLTITNK